MKDLTNSVCMLIHEGLEYRFSHRSFQEYFAALYTIQLDDIQQKRFLKLWLQSDVYRTTSNYLDMLYELEPSRFVKNVIVPGIRELKGMFEENGESEEWLIDFICESVYVKEKNKGKICTIVIKETYFYEMIRRACDIGGFYKNHMNKEKNQQNRVSEKNLIGILESKHKIGSNNRFSQIEQKENEKKMLETLYRIIERYKFAVCYVESIDKDPLARKKKFSSMLEEL